MTEGGRQAGKLNLTVFISYSRDDLAFSDQLDVALGLHFGFCYHARPPRHFRRRGLEATARQSDPRCRYRRFRAVARPRRAPRSAPGRSRRRSGSASASSLCCAGRSTAQVRRHSWPTSTTSSSIPSRNRRALDLARGWCVWSRPSIPISTGCASTRGFCSAPPNGRRAAGRPTGCCRAATSRRQEPGPRGGRRRRRRRPILHVEFFRASEEEEGRRQNAELQRLQQMAEAQAARGAALEEKEAAQKREAEAQKRRLNRQSA